MHGPRCIVQQHKRVLAGSRGRGEGREEETLQRLNQNFRELWFNWHSCERHRTAYPRLTRFQLWRTYFWKVAKPRMRCVGRSAVGGRQVSLISSSPLIVVPFSIIFLTAMNYEGGFWATVDLMTGSSGLIGWQRRLDPFTEDVSEWLANVTPRLKTQLERDKLTRGSICDKTRRNGDEGGMEVQVQVDYGSMIDCRYSLFRLSYIYKRQDN